MHYERPNKEDKLFKMQNILYIYSNIIYSKPYSKI